MDFVFDLLMGAGIAAGIGIRPFLPVLLVGALAAGDIGIDFDGTDFAFLEQAALLAVVIVLLAVSIYVARRAGPGALEVQPWAYLFGTYAVVMGILYAAGVDGRGRREHRPRDHRRARCARPRPRRRARPAVAHPQAARHRGRQRAAALRRGRGAARRRRLRAVPAARRPRDRRAARAAAGRPPPCAARSTPACASCDERRRGEAEEARPHRHRRHEARDARAGGR